MRIRIRGTIIRIQITEPRIRTIIRISRQEGTPDHFHQYFQISKSLYFSLPRVLQSVKNGTSGTQGAQPHTRNE